MPPARPWRRVSRSAMEARAPAWDGRPTGRRGPRPGQWPGERWLMPSATTSRNLALGWSATAARISCWRRTGRVLRTPRRLPPGIWPGSAARRSPWPRSTSQATDRSAAPRQRRPLRAWWPTCAARGLCSRAGCWRGIPHGSGSWPLVEAGARAGLGLAPVSNLSGKEAALQPQGCAMPAGPAHLRRRGFPQGQRPISGETPISQVCKPPRKAP